MLSSNSSLMNVTTALYVEKQSFYDIGSNNNPLSCVATLQIQTAMRSEYYFQGPPLTIRPKA